MTNITERIYERHMQALRRISGEGTWIDEPAARMALWLALTEQADRLAAVPPLDDCIRDLETALTAAQNEAAMLRQQRGELEERASMLRKSLSDLEELYDARGIDLANERAAADTLRAAITQQQIEIQQAKMTITPASPNGHVADPTPAHPAAVGAEPGEEVWLESLNDEQRHAVQQLKAKTMIWKNLQRATKAGITQAVVLTLIDQVAPVKLGMADYDQMKPQWMPGASGIAALFGDQKWSLLLERVRQWELA